LGRSEDFRDSKEFSVQEISGRGLRGLSAKERKKKKERE
jgi:hypothetical protein